MGNQRRFAAQAYDPPQTARNRGRRRNDPKPSPFPPTGSCAKLLPHFPYPIVRSVTLSVGAVSRSRRLFPENPVSDDPHAVRGAADSAGCGRRRLAYSRGLQERPPGRFPVQQQFREERSWLATKCQAGIGARGLRGFWLSYGLEQASGRHGIWKKPNLFPYRGRISYAIPRPDQF